MKDLIRYISRFVPDFGDSVESAPPSAIETVQSFVQQTLPADYLDYLATMGRSSADFRVYQGGFDLGIQAVLHYYQQADTAPPDKSVFVGRGLSGTGLDLYLQRIQEDGEPVVIQSGGANSDETYLEYPGFANMLFSFALSRYRLRRMKFQSTLQDAGTGRSGRAGSIIRLRTLGNVIEDFKLTAVPHTGTWVPCYEGPEVALRAYEPEGGGPTYSLSSNDEQTFETILTWLIQHLGLIQVI